MAGHLFKLVQTKNRSGGTRKAHTKMNELVRARVCGVLCVCTMCLWHVCMKVYAHTHVFAQL